MKILLLNKQKKIKLDTVMLKKISMYISEKFDNCSEIQLNIVFVSKKKIRELNSMYRNISGPTDVLSFSYSERVNLSAENNEIGEIIICPEIAEQNLDTGTSGSDFYKFYNNKLEKNIIIEITLLMIHGFLHLYGYDHERKWQRVELELAQKELLMDAIDMFSIGRS
jgi:probable rRNA maturation factor